MKYGLKMVLQNYYERQPFQQRQLCPRRFDLHKCQCLLSWVNTVFIYCSTFFYSVSFVFSSANKILIKTLFFFILLPRSKIFMTQTKQQKKYRNQQQSVVICYAKTSQMMATFIDPCKNIDEIFGSVIIFFSSDHHRRKQYAMIESVIIINLTVEAFRLHVVI